jgi:drug/metabolite transporter (DMT)-like permease
MAVSNGCASELSLEQGSPELSTRYAWLAARAGTRIAHGLCGAHRACHTGGIWMGQINMLIGVLCGLGAGALWGLVFLAPAWLAGWSPLELAVGRYSAYGAIALLLMAPRLSALLARLERADYWALLRHALSGNIVYYVLLALAVKLAGVAPTSLIIGLLPVSVTIVGSMDHGALTLRELARPLALVALGIACINIDVFSQAPLSGVTPAGRLGGLLCAAGALLCWTWYAVDNARFLKRTPRYSSAEWSALYGMASGVVAAPIALVLLALAALEDGPARDWQTFLLANAALALLASVIGNHLWNVASRRVPVTLSGQLILFETLFALLYGFLYEGRWPRALEWAAMVLLAAGVIWAVHAHRTDEALVPE